MLRKRRFPLRLALVALIVAGLVLLVMMLRPGWTVDRVRDVAITTLQQETAASEMVTGRVGVSARREISDRGRFSWIPDWMGVPGVNLVGAGVRVEIAGDAAYGFDVRSLTPDMISLAQDGFIEIDLPPLQIVAVEPDLTQLLLETREGLFRAGASRSLEQEALSDIQDALRAQGERHLTTSQQPQINSGRALAAILRPAYRAAGMSDPRFRVRIGGGLVLETTGTEAVDALEPLQPAED